MNKKVLIVDDDPDIVKLVQNRLVKEGYQTVFANDGKSALEAACSQKPDLIILDVMMPPPNGFQVCRTLKDDPQLRSIPVILLTAKGTDSDKFWGVEAGADSYLTKPYDHKELLDKVHEFLDR